MEQLDTGSDDVCICKIFVSVIINLLFVKILRGEIFEKLGWSNFLNRFRNLGHEGDINSSFINHKRGAFNYVKLLNSLK